MVLTFNDISKQATALLKDLYIVISLIKLIEINSLSVFEIIIYTIGLIFFLICLFLSLLIYITCNKERKHNINLLFVSHLYKELISIYKKANNSYYYALSLYIILILINII